MLIIRLNLVIAVETTFIILCRRRAKVFPKQKGKGKKKRKETRLDRNFYFQGVYVSKKIFGSNFCSATGQ